MARTVLVADDSPTITRKIEGILKGEGFDVKTFSNGVSAIKKLPTIKPLVILADVLMPGKDGYEVCDFVKTSPDLSHIPVVLIFSDMEEYDEQRAARVRADGRIMKRSTGTPFDSEELISTVAKFMAMAEAAVKPQMAPTVITAPPREPIIVTAPMDEEALVAPREEAPDFSSFSEGVAFAEQPLEEIAMAPPEASPPATEPMMETEISGEPEAAAGAAEELPAAPSPAGEEAPIPTEPVLIEEPAALAPEVSPTPTAERTMMFRLPADIAAPVLSDELAAAPPPAAQMEPEEAPVDATTLESFSLAEATTGQVRFAPSGAEGAYEAEPAMAAPEPAEEVAATPAPAVPLSADQIYSVVHKVVVRMSPPVLSPQDIEDLARKLTEEVTAEINEESFQGQ